MNSAVSKPTLFIGYGNSLRGDDGLGLYVVQRIAEQNWPDVETLSAHQLTPELSQQIANAERVVFVDAAMEGDEPFRIACIEPHPESACDSHLGDPRALLSLAKSLYGKSPQAWTVAVRGCEFDLGEELSPVARVNAEKALAALKLMVESEKEL